MPSPRSYASYEAWAEWVFTRAHLEFEGALPDTPGMDAIPSGVRAAYFMRMMENGEFVVSPYSEKQIAGAVWYLFGVAGSYWARLDDPGVPSDLALRCLRAVPQFYRNVLLPVCDEYGRAKDIDLTDSRAVDTAVYMIWDMDQIQYFAFSTPERKAIAWSILAEILEMDSFTCRKSALHGLGHAAMKDESRSREIIDDFLAQHPNLPQELRSYADCARDGAVM